MMKDMLKSLSCFFGWHTLIAPSHIEYSKIEEKYMKFKCRICGRSKLFMLHL